MRNFGCTSAALLSALAVSTASAADLPARQARVDVPVAAYAPRWDGVYFGLSGGGAWGRSDGAVNVSSATLALFPPVLPTIDAGGTNRIKFGGALLGAQVGYNFAIGDRFVLGAESDLSWTNLSGAVSTGGIVPIFNGPFSFNQSVRADWLATLRGRAGFAPFNDFLVYATGGLAAARIRAASDFADSFNEYEFYRNSATRLGWTVGAGLEYAIGPNWSAKLEYLHSEFGTLSGLGSSLLVDGSTAWVQHRAGRPTMDSARFGVNYRFGDSQPAPIVARY
jgi:outer membrane immunogenic protein